MNNQAANSEVITLEDLAAHNAEEIKGGPSTQSKRIVVLKSDVVDEQADDTATLNHNETVIADNETQEVDSEADTQKLADLTIDGETESTIKGGILLPAVQKVR